MADSKIVVNARFLTQPMTGTQRYAYNIVQRFPRDVRLVAPEPPAPPYPRIPPERVDVARSRFSSHLWEQFVLPKHVSRDELLWSPGGLGSVFIKNYVLTITDLALFENPECYGRAFGAWYRTMYPRAARNARRILTISDFTRGVISRILRIPDKNIVVTHLGVDERFRPQPDAGIAAMRERLGIGEKYVLAVGAVSPRKNIARLLEAWDRVADRVPDAQLVLVAEDKFAFSGMAGMERLPRRCVHLKGIDDDTLALLYAGAAVFAYPSIYEGFGLPVVEAMASGAPVVTSNVTSLPEVAGDAAVLVDPYDTDAIGEAIVSVLDDRSLRDSLRSKGFARAAAFSWDRTARETWATLQEAAS